MVPRNGSGSPELQLPFSCLARRFWSPDFQPSGRIPRSPDKKKAARSTSTVASLQHQVALRLAPGFPLPSRRCPAKPVATQNGSSHRRTRRPAVARRASTRRPDKPGAAAVAAHRKDVPGQLLEPPAGRRTSQRAAAERRTRGDDSWGATGGGGGFRRSSRTWSLRVANSIMQLAEPHARTHDEPWPSVLPMPTTRTTDGSRSTCVR